MFIIRSAVLVMATRSLGMGSCATATFTANQQLQSSNKRARRKEARACEIREHEFGQVRFEVTELRLCVKRSPSQSLRSRSRGHGVSEDLAKVASPNDWKVACPTHLEDIYYDSPCWQCRTCER